MNRRRFVCGSILGVAMGARSVAATTSVRALTGDSLFDGISEVRLIDVLAPAPLDPYGHDATLLLARLIATGPVSVSDAAPADRWGRRVARASIGIGAETLQELLVANGAVRVCPESGDSPFITMLLECEREARLARRGLWADWRYRVFEATAAEPAVGAFNIVEGVVVQAVARGGRAYLNFGEDYRTDFTVTARTGAAKKWAKDGSDLLLLAGARVRARGYVAWINGPSIELNHRQQLEVIAAPFPSGTPTGAVRNQKGR